MLIVFFISYLILRKLGKHQQVISIYINLLVYEYLKYVQEKLAAFVNKLAKNINADEAVALGETFPA